MKLVEVVFLIGSHCVSPIQHATPVTEVFKVQCAVVVERDTVANSVQVTPSTEAGNPLVIAAVERLQAPVIPPAAEATGTSPVSEPAPAAIVDEPSGAISRRASLSEFRARPEVIGTNEFQNPPAETVDESDIPQSATEMALDEEEPAPRKLQSKSRATKTAKKSKSRVKNVVSRCGAGRRAVWYTNKDGRRKYRCQRSSGPQLY